MTHLRMLVPLAASFLIQACARDGTVDYPSLARRPAEATGFAEPELPAAPPVAADPALDARVGELQRGLQAAATGFGRDAVAAERAGRAARGRAVGSEAWLAAQSALAELDSWRSQASTLAGDADALAIARAGAGEQNYPSLERLREALRVEVERETAEIARIGALTPAA